MTYYRGSLKVVGFSLALAALIVAPGCGDNKSGGKKGGGPAAPEGPGGTVDPNAGGNGGQTPAPQPGTYGLQFVTPDAEELQATDKVEVVVKFTGVPAGSTWNLYYGTNASSFEGTTAILTDLPMTTTKVAWETSFVDAGTYFLFATVKSGDVMTMYSKAGSVVVKGAASDGRTPFVVVTQPNNSTVYTGAGAGNAAGAMRIQWTATDPDGEDMAVRLEYAVDGETNWKPIVGDLNADTTFYDWQIPAGLTQSARYKVRVVAKDESGKEGEGKTRVFGVSDTVVTYSNDLKTTFDMKCATVGCHSSMNPANNFRADVYADAADTTTNKVGTRINQITNRTRLTTPDNQRMPRNGITLSTAELDRIQLWQWFNGPE